MNAHVYHLRSFFTILGHSPSSKLWNFIFPHHLLVHDLMTFFHFAFVASYLFDALLSRYQSLVDNSFRVLLHTTFRFYVNMRL